MPAWQRTYHLPLHHRQLAEHGGGSELRDAGLLDSALARSQQLHAYGDPPPDLADLAASLAFELARKHPFVDGNKRTAHVCYRVFLQLNGFTLVASNEDKYTSMLALAEGSMPEAEFAAWLRRHIQLEPASGVHEPPKRYAGMAGG
ncbi:type II toxin-antitoxin system death-on-curing family toxin [Lysobacter sp. A289]